MALINPLNQCNCSGVSPYDYEYMQIIRKLAQYGLRPTGSKSSDKIRLHEVELRQAQKENCITSKFLTVSTKEQEKIQEKKQEKKEETNPEIKENPTKGQEILGQQ